MYGIDQNIFFPDAHSLEEIQEWRERLEYRQKRAQMASKLYQSFNDQVMERLGQSGTSVNQVLALNLDGVNCTCNKSANVTCQKSQNGDIVDWTFKLSSTSKRLRNISLLSDNGANNFQVIIFSDPAMFDYFSFVQALRWSPTTFEPTMLSPTFWSGRVLKLSNSNLILNLMTRFNWIIWALYHSKLLGSKLWVLS